MRITKGLKQAYDAQELAHAQLMRYAAQLAERTEITPADASAINTLISALDRAQDRVRIHRRVPLPGVARPQALGKGRSKSGGRDVSAFLASLAPQQQGTSSAPDQASGDAPDQAAEQPDPDQAGPAGT